MTAAATFDLADLTGDASLDLVVEAGPETPQTPQTLVPITKGLREKIEIAIPYDVWNAGSRSALDIRRDERIGKWCGATRTWTMTRQKAHALADAILRRGSTEARDAAELIALAAGCLAPHAAQARAERVERARQEREAERVVRAAQRALEARRSVSARHAPS